MIDNSRLLLGNPSLLKALTGAAEQGATLETGQQLGLQPTVSKVKEFDGKGKSRVAEIWLEDIEDMSTLYNWEADMKLKTAVTGLTGLAREWW